MHPHASTSDGDNGSGKNRACACSVFAGGVLFRPVWNRHAVGVLYPCYGATFLSLSPCTALPTLTQFVLRSIRGRTRGALPLSA